MTAVRRVDEGPVASRRALVAGMEEVARTVRNLAAASGDVHALLHLQHAAYVDEHLALVDDLARHASLVVVCTDRPRLPEGVAHVELDAEDTLVQELSIVVTSRAGGIALLGRELASTLPAPTLEAGRAFRWESTADRTGVVGHLRRLLRDLGARVEPHLTARLLAGVTGMARSDEDAVAGCNDRVVVTVRTADEQRHLRAAPEPGTGGMAALADWLADAGPRAPRLGLLVVRAAPAPVDRDELRDRMQDLARTGDLVVTVPPDAAMLVLPGLVGARLSERATDVARELREALAIEDVAALAQEVPAEEARRDLVGQLGSLLSELRTAAPVG